MLIFFVLNGNTTCVKYSNILFAIRCLCSLQISILKGNPSKSFYVSIKLHIYELLHACMPKNAMCTYNMNWKQIRTFHQHFSNFFHSVFNDIPIFYSAFNIATTLICTRFDKEEPTIVYQSEWNHLALELYFYMIEGDVVTRKLMVSNLLL